MITFFIKDPIYNLFEPKVGVINSLIIELVGIVLIDAIIYLVSLFFLKEDLINSFRRKKKDA